MQSLPLIAAVAPIESANSTNISPSPGTVTLLSLSGRGIITDLMAYERVAVTVAAAVAV
jgi:hypothetical protein